MKPFSVVRCGMLIGIMFYVAQVAAFGQNLYQFSAEQGVYQPLDQTKANYIPLSSGIGYSDKIDIGFNFKFNFAEYSQFVVNEWGGVTFNFLGREGGTVWNMKPYYNGDVRQATVHTQLTGTAPNRVLTIEFSKMIRFNILVYNVFMDFQIKLYETTNRIEYVYKQEACEIEAYGGNIGLQFNETSYFLLNNSGTSPTATEVTLADQYADLPNEIDSRPANGQIYRFDRVVKPEPTNQPTSFAATRVRDRINLTWADATGSQLPDGYLIKASTKSTITNPIDFNDLDTISPLGWTIQTVKGVTGEDVWRFDNPTNRDPDSPIDDHFAIFERRSISSIEANLTTPEFDATSPNPVILQFDQEFASYEGDTIAVEVFDGASWHRVYERTDDVTDHQTIDISSYVQNVTNAKVRFRWVGEANFWIVDNVNISLPTPFSEDFTPRTPLNLSNGNGIYKVPYGTQSFSGFYNMKYDSTYYFKIYSYTNKKTLIDYNTIDAPQTSITYTANLEPTNQPTGFKAKSDGSKVTLKWTDATVTEVPDKYIILVSTNNSFTALVDGTDPVEDNDLSDGTALVKVSQGTQTYSGFSGLQSGTTYYFRIYPYTNSGTKINFKTDGDIASSLVYFFSGTAFENTLNFDGADDYVNLGNQNPTVFTAEAWVNLTVNNTDQAVVSTLNESNPAGFELHIGPNGAPTLTIRSSNSWVDVTSPNILPVYTWVHLAVTYDGAVAKLYVNGILSSSANISTFNIGSYPLKLGIRSTAATTQYFSGSMDEVRIWDKSLSETEIQKNIYSVLSGNETGLLSYYNFNQGTSSSDNSNVKALNDISSNGNNGSLNNFALTGSTSNWQTRNSAQTQVSYVFTPLSGTFTPLTGATSVIATDIDDNLTSAINIGFNFVYNGTAYTQFKASSNGFITFNTSTSNSENTNNLAGATSRPLIAPLWDDLRTGTGSYKLEGTAPNRVLTFEWLNCKWNYNASNYGISFQVKLYESSNRIEFIYHNLSGAVSSGSASIGLCFPTSGYNSLNNTSTNPTNSSTSETSNINTKPAEGQIYRFEKEPSDYPANFSVTGGNSNLSLNWTDAGGILIPEGYYIVASKTNSFTDLTDGTEPTVDNDLSDGYGVVKVLQGVQTYSDWKHSEFSDNWYFRIYPYLYNGSIINYKNNNSVPQASITLPHYLYTHWESSLTALNLGDLDWIDFNKDGELDIISAGNSSAGGFRAYKYVNNGNRTFTESQISGIGLINTAMDFADYDNDGDIDFVVCGSSDEYTVIPHTKIFRNEAGSFVEQTDISIVGLSHGDVKWFDINNDGLKDFIVTGLNESGREVSKIYQNTGNNSFSDLPLSNIEGIRNGSIACGDYNNDGFTDILMVGGYPDLTVDGKTLLYKNNGDNTFAEQKNINLPTLYSSYADWGDYDNDGDLDILLAGVINKSYGKDLCAIYRNDGNNTFTKQANFLLEKNSVYRSIKWADYDNDGYLDIFQLINTEYRTDDDGNTIQNEQNSTQIYHNERNGAFTRLLTDTVYIAAGNMSFGDFDNDRDLDLLIINKTSNDFSTNLYINNNHITNTPPEVPTGLTAIQNRAKITFKWNKSTDNSTPVKGITYNIRIGTSSGGNDVFSAQAMADGTLLLPTEGNMRTDTSLTLTLTNGTYYWSVQAIDKSLTASAFATEQVITTTEIQAANLSAEKRDANLFLRWDNGNHSNRVVFCKKASTGNAIPVNGKNYNADPYFGKGDQIGSTGWFCIYNGKADSTMVYNLNPSSSYIFQVFEYDRPSETPTYLTTTANGNPGVFGVSHFIEQLNSVTGLPSSPAGGSVSWTDFDNDGYLDACIFGDYSMSIYKNNGDNTFSLLYNATSQNYTTQTWGDFNNDGYKDLLVSYYYSQHHVELYKNNNGNSLDLTNISFPNSSDGSMSWIDYNNDGLLDVYVSGSDIISINNGDETFSTQNIGITNFAVRTGSWGDMDNDGDLDLVATSTDSVKVFRNDNNTFTELPNTAMSSHLETVIRWADFDNDGFLDIFINASGIFTGYLVGIYHNNGNSTFTFHNLNHTVNPYWGCQIDIGDCDNDGYLDVIATGTTWNGLREDSKLYINTHDNSFKIDSISNLFNLFNSSVNFGDNDNDGDLDIILYGKWGSANTGGTILRTYQNTTIMKAGNYEPNKLPAAPENLKNEELRGGILLSWDGVKTDETPIITLSYNLRVGSSKDSMNLFTPNFVDSSLYKRRSVNQIGNIGLNTFYKLHNLPDLPNNGYYYWQVQAVDGGFEGGTWSKLDSFKVKAAQAYFSADTVCLGTPTIFIDNSVAYDGIVAWHWDFGDTTYSSEQNPQHKYLYPGNHAVKLIVTNSAKKTDSLLDTIYVKPLPPISIAVNTTCSQLSVKLANSTPTSGITSWLWNFDDGATSAYANPGSHVYSDTGTYHVSLKVTNDQSCSNTVTQRIVLTENPSTALTLESGSSTFCNGDSVCYSVPYRNYYKYQWIRETDTLALTSNKIMIKDFGGSYKVRVTNLRSAVCYKESSPVMVTIKARPAQPTITIDGNLVFCDGDSSKLSVSPQSGVTYSWKLNGGSIGTNSPDIYVKESGNYTAELSYSSTGCSIFSGNSKTIISNSLPDAPAVSASGATTFCQGKSISLTTTSISGVSYQWKNGTSIIDGATNPALFVNASGNYSIVATNTSNNCSRTSDVTSVTVNDKPSKPELAVDGLLTFCSGDSATISTTVTGVTYNWLPEGSGNSNSNSLIAKTAGNYRLSVSNGNCTSDTSSIVAITVNPLPEIKNFSYGQTEFCKGKNVLFSVSNNAALNYQWKRGNENITNATSNQYSADETGIYWLQVNNGSCFAQTPKVSVTVNPVPDAATIEAGSKTTFCEGDSVVLRIGKQSGVSYHWKPDGVLKDTLSNQYVARQSGTYAVELSIGNCSVLSTNSIVVKVNSNPSVPSLNYGKTSVCSGETVDFSTDNKDGLKYQWKNDDVSIKSAISNTYSAIESGNYWLNVTDANGCSIGTKKINVTITEKPAVPILMTANNETSFCEGYPFTIKVQNTANDLVYQWYRNGALYLGGEDGNLSGTLLSGDYSVEAYKGSCTTSSNKVTLTYKEGPTKPGIIALGPNYWYLACLNDTAKGYQWYYNGQLIEGESKYQYLAETNLGVYQVKVNEGGECWASSDLLKIPDNTTVQPKDTSKNIKITKMSPNPSSGQFKVAVYSTDESLIDIMVMTLEGKIIYQTRALKSAGNFEFPITLKSKGAFIVRVSQNNVVVSDKMIIN